MHSCFLVFLKNVLRTCMALDVRNLAVTVLTRNSVITRTDIVPSDVMRVCMGSNVTKVFNDVYYDKIHFCLIFVC